jgi:tetratricopeptide (TPR) repeat protein
VLMSARVIFPRCLALWVIVGVGVAQCNPIFHDTPLPARGEGSKAKAAELNRQGSESVGAKQFEQAKVLFKQAIQLDPKLSDAYENLALILLLDGNDAAAEHTAVELLALAPGNYNARLVAGVAALNRNSFSRGRDYLIPLISSGADDPLVITAYAIVLEGTGPTAEAARNTAVSAKLQVKAADALLAGQIFRQPRLKATAQKWMEASITNGDSTVNLDLLYLLAAMYAEQGRLSDACALYIRMLEVSPGNIDALIELSELERRLGQQEKSISHLHAAKVLAATDVATLVHFSQVCIRRRMYVDAADALRKVVAQDPLNRHAWYQLGLAQFRLGETQAAETDFRTALTLDGNDEWPRVGLGAVLMSTARQQEAAAEFQRVLQRDPRSAAAHYYLAQIHRAEGNIPLALRDLQQAVNYAKDDARPLAALGQLQLAQHDLLSARASLTKAIELDPGYALAHYQMARLLNATGEQAEAATELELFNKYHDEENKKGIVGMVSDGKWDYVGYLPPN